MKNPAKEFFLEYVNIYLDKGPRPLRSLFQDYETAFFIDDRLTKVFKCMDDLLFCSISEAKEAMEKLRKKEASP